MRLPHTLCTDSHTDAQAHRHIDTDADAQTQTQPQRHSHRRRHIDTGTEAQTQTHAHAHADPDTQTHRRTSGSLFALTVLGVHRYANNKVGYQLTDVFGHPESGKHILDQDCKTQDFDAAREQ